MTSWPKNLRFALRRRFAGAGLRVADRMGRLSAPSSHLPGHQPCRSANLPSHQKLRFCPGTQPSFQEEQRSPIWHANHERVSPQKFGMIQFRCCSGGMAVGGRVSLPSSERNRALRCPEQSRSVGLKNERNAVNPSDPESKHLGVIKLAFSSGRRLPVRCPVSGPISCPISAALPSSRDIDSFRAAIFSAESGLNELIDGNPIPFRSFAGGYEVNWIISNSTHPYFISSQSISCTEIVEASG